MAVMEQSQLLGAKTQLLDPEVATQAMTVFVGLSLQPFSPRYQEEHSWWPTEELL